jgi:hypothetical protein
MFSRERGSDWERKRGAGLLGSVGLELERPQARRSFGEKFQWPGGAIGRGKKGEEERRLWPSYRRGAGKKRQGN